ncbi:MAG: peptidylprolyl isomerase [Deltaproteobacteria bacterium]|nr:peptidylprolyl isomerase [Deltaproteobacteria bacterium]
MSRSRFAETGGRVLPMVALLLTACGGNAASAPSPKVSASASQTDVGNSAYVANKATDPRTGDPTAQPPPPAKVEAPAPTDPPAVVTSTPSAKSPPADPPKRIAARHVLIQWIGAQKASPEVLRSREQALAVAEEVLKKAKAGADVGRLAVDYSDEPGAGLRGGSLGKFGRGAMVPAFEKAVFALGVGEISEIVETPFGFHIIQRTE